MAYDPVKTQTLLTTIGHYSRLPGAEFIKELGDQLREADKEISGTFGTIREAKTAASNAEVMYRDAVRERNIFREKLEAFTDGLQQIATGKEKVAKKIAADLLTPPVAKTASKNVDPEPISAD